MLNRREVRRLVGSLMDERDDARSFTEFCSIAWLTSSTMNAARYRSAHILHFSSDCSVYNV